ncbi:hypothetical protein ABK040_007463 [Willaertia magna]
MYQVLYFNFPGRGEIAKLIAHVGQVPYTTKYFTREEWPEYKPKTTFGKLPILKKEGDESFELHESTAIARHLAKEGNLYPTDLNLSSKSEELVLTIYDSSVAYVRAVFAGEDKKEEAIKKYLEEDFQVLLSILDKLLGKTQKYLLGDDLYWCDLYLLDFLLFATGAGGDISSFTNVVEWKKRVDELERVKAFFESENNLRKKQ